MSNAVRFLGTTDDVTTCECCGKKDLKSTVAISIDDGDPIYYGVTCAALALKRGVRDVRSETLKADRMKEEEARRAAQAKQTAESAPWFAYIRSNGVGGDDFTRIESLGGYAAARAAFNATRTA